VRGRLIALSVLAGIVVPPSSALAAPPGGIGIRLVDVPAGSRDGTLARSYVVDRLAPGTSIRRRVEIVNSTGSIAEVAVYPAAARVSRGAFLFAPGHGGNELAGWTSVSRDVLRLPPGTSAFETVTIRVPKEASAAERYAVVWAEVSLPAPAAGGVTLVNRVGIRMYVSISPGGAPASSFVIGSLTAERSPTGDPLVVATVHNTGASTLAISGNLTLSEGPGGVRAGPFPVRLETALAPDDSEAVAVLLDRRLSRGSWRARLRLTSGLVQRTATATITFPPGVPANEPPASVPPADSRRLILIVALLIVLLAAAASALVISRRLASATRRR
jgi:hypothetical protein